MRTSGIGRTCITVSLSDYRSQDRAVNLAGAGNSISGARRPFTILSSCRQTRAPVHVQIRSRSLCHVCEGSKAQQSATPAPDARAPQLLCPTCNHPLVFRETVINGVEPI